MLGSPSVGLDQRHSKLGGAQDGMLERATGAGQPEEQAQGGAQHRIAAGVGAACDPIEKTAKKLNPWIELEGGVLPRIRQTWRIELDQCAGVRRRS
jgi:hypothetical protein